MSRGGGENRNLKNPGIDFYSGFRKKCQGGVQIEILKIQEIYFYSGCRKKMVGGGGGGGENRNPKKKQEQTFIVALGKMVKEGCKSKS